MKITKSKLRQIIKEELEHQQTAAQLSKNYDQFFDKAETFGSNFLEDLADEVKAAGEKKRDLEEALGLTVALSLAAASPILMQGIAKLSSALAAGLKKIGQETGMDLDGAAENTEAFGAWWGEKSKALHHAYVGGVEKIIDAVCFIAGKNPSKDKRHKAAKAIWTVIVAYLMVLSGFGALKAAAHHTYGVYALETVLSSVKAGEVGAYLGPILEAMLFSA
jgi:hypothetical protein